MRPLHHRRALAIVLCIASACALGAAPLHGPVPTIVVPTTDVPATADFHWTMNLELKNPTSRGAYTDSLVCEAMNLSPGVTRGPRTRRVPIDALVRTLPALGTMDSVWMTFTSVAWYERARLTFRYYTRDADGHHMMSADTVLMGPGEFALDNPSLSFQPDSIPIEFYYVRGRGGAASAPAVLLLHGDQSDARDLLPLAQAVSGAGYNVMAISQPGYGTSGGRPDMTGGATMQAVDAALQALRRSRGVDSMRVAVWGIERGGTIAARLAMTRPELAGAIATRGLYDLPVIARGSRRVHGSLVTEAGRDTAQWRRLSPVSLPPQLRAPLLVESTATDAEIPATQAQAFASRLQLASQPVETRTIDGADRSLPVGSARDEGLAFLARIFKKP